jgi:hypothetical protein
MSGPGALLSRAKETQQVRKEEGIDEQLESACRMGERRYVSVTQGRRSPQCESAQETGSWLGI